MLRQTVIWRGTLHTWGRQNPSAPRDSGIRLLQRRSLKLIYCCILLAVIQILQDALC